MYFVIMYNYKLLLCEKKILIRPNLAVNWNIIFYTNSDQVFGYKFNIYLHYIYIQF